MVSGRQGQDSSVGSFVPEEEDEGEDVQTHSLSPPGGVRWIFRKWRRGRAETREDLWM